ncbi:MAG: SusC/RagA family TonB-linked outer membrane protein [Bacteroidota bacterium]
MTSFKLKRWIFTTIGLCFSTFFLFGQTKTIQGTVVSAEDNLGLPGVSIYLKNKASLGTISDIDGTYTIEGTPEDTLVFSYISFQTVERLIGPLTTIDVAMQSSTALLDEVVVTALGMKREKKALGYAVQEIDGADIGQTRELNVVNSLSGKVAGVNITQGGGGIGGGGARVVIRGETSLAGNNGPLFVIDGIPAGSNDVASDDIASISVLKGPAAAALYGSRAAAGVVLITTKSGAGSEKNRVGVDVNLSMATQRPFILPDYQNEFGQGTGNQYQYFDGNNGTFPDGSISNDDSRINWGPRFDGQERPQFTGRDPWVAHPDNVRDFYETGFIANNNVAVYGASDAGSFRLSYTNILQNGVVPNTGLAANRLDLSGSWNISDKLNIRANAKLIDERSDNTRSVDVRLYPRNIDIQALQDYWVPGLEGLQQLKWRNSQNNPYFELFENRSAFKRTRLLGNITANYQITEKLSLMGRIGENRSFNDQNRRAAFSTVGTGVSFNGLSAGTDNRFGYYGTGQATSQELNADFLLRYQQGLGEHLNAIVSFGGNHLRASGSSVNSLVSQLLIPNIYNIGNRRVFPRTNNGISERRINSFYGFANLAYKNFLYLDVTARNDWSSTLPVDNNSYFYPSFTLSGLVHEVVDLPNAISFLKLRGGIARVGSDTGPYALQDQFQWGQGENGVASIIQSNVKANPDLKPEITSAWEVGADLRLFQNRIGLDLTYYNSLTFNQILRVEVSPTTGYDFILKNAGKIRSTGWEVVLNADVVQGGKFQWNTTLNWSRDRSIVEEYDLENPDAFLSRGVTNFLFVEDRLGERRGALYGKTFQTAPNGEILFTKSGDTQRGTKEFLGNYNPDWMGSMFNQFQYGPLSFSFLVDVRYGGVFYSQTNYNLNIRGLSEVTLLGGTDANGNPTPRENILPDGMILDDGEYRKLTREDLIESGLSSGGLTGQQYWENVMDAEIPDAVIFDATYLKLRELSLSYALPERFLSKMAVRSAQVGIVMRNIAVWTEVPNVDAETFSSAQDGAAGAIPGFDRGGVPSLRNIAFNLNLKF